jgi:drug/metabolite transporter (DMT)-like permease
MRSNTTTGFLAALAAALTGAIWQITTRYGVTTTLGPVEVAVMRYCVPGVILLPLLWRLRFWPRGVSLPHGLLLIAGGGLGFGLMVLAGASYAPAAHMGIFMAGTLPVFTGLAMHLFFGDRLTPVRWVGLALVVGGVACLGFSSWVGARDGSWRGDVLFLLAAMVWAAYTIAFRRSGLSAWQGAAFVNGWSAVLLLPVIFIFGAPRLLTAPWQDVALQAAGQGVIAGLMGLVAFSIAVEKLGAARASLSAAAVPVLTTVGAAVVLGESITLGTALAIGLVVPGIALASRR